MCSVDIEQEANGLYTFDRKEKLAAEEVKRLIDESLKMFYERVGEKGGCITGPV